MTATSMTTEREDEAGPKLSDKALAAIIESVIWRQSILVGGDGGISDAIAEWRSEGHLRESNKIIEELSLKIARRVLKYVPSPAPTGDGEEPVAEAGAVTLLPCPHCGQAAGIMQAAGVFQAFCGDSQCLSIQTYETRDEAVRAWNTRTAPATSVGEFVLVPREPTEEMLRAGGREGAIEDQLHVRVGKVYRAMLAAAPATSAPAGDGEAEKLAADIAEATGCDNPRYNVGFTAKINRTIGFWRGVVAALRRAQPPQPTGDVGGLIVTAQNVAKVVRYAQGFGVGEIIDDLVAALRSADSRSAAQAQELRESYEEQNYTNDLLGDVWAHLEGDEGYENAKPALLEQLRAWSERGKARLGSAALSPTEPAGRG